MNEIAAHIDFTQEPIFDIPEQQDDSFRPIQEKDFVEELEYEVDRYMSASGVLPINKKKYKHIEVPKDTRGAGFTVWAKEEIRRCTEGYDGLCGKMYFYYNYCRIQSIGKQIRPQFRVIDAEWFRFVEACQKSNEWGIICVKRRRVGASWKEAADVLHDCLFSRGFQAGINSKMDRDSFELLRKIKYIYNNIPLFMRAATTSNSRDYFEFSYYTKDENGNKIKKGNLSGIIAVAPTPNAFEGRMLSKWVCDEAGKIKDLAAMWSYTEDCLLQETRRVGLPIIFGTAGDITKEGKDLEYMWRNSDAYRLKRFFFSGWMGLNCDEYGNDDKRGCIRWIVYERQRRAKLKPEELNTFIQKYPLTVEEAFTITQSAGVGDAIKIRAQRQSLFEAPPKSVRGKFRLNPNGEAEWVPSASGKIIIYEHPEVGVENKYIGGCDPADHEEVTKEASDLALYIFKRQSGTEPARVVCEYVDRPKEVIEFFDQAILCALYYNKAKLLIERNRYLMIHYFKQHGQVGLLARTPSSIARIYGGKTDTVGLQMSSATKEYLTGCIAKYIKDYVSWIPSRELLDEFLYFGARNTDRAMAFGIGLVYLDDNKSQIYTTEQFNKKIPHFGYVRTNGTVKRVTYKQKPSVLDGYNNQKLDLSAQTTRTKSFMSRKPNRYNIKKLA